MPIANVNKYIFCIIALSAINFQYHFLSSWTHFTFEVGTVIVFQLEVNFCDAKKVFDESPLFLTSLHEGNTKNKNVCTNSQFYFF